MPPQTDVSDVKDYRIVCGDPVTLEIDVLKDQVGGSVVEYRGSVEDYRDPHELETGDGVELCHTRTVVRDVNPATDDTLVRYRLSGGVEDETHEYPARATEGGLVTYRITFVFVPTDGE